MRRTVVCLVLPLFFVPPMALAQEGLRAVLIESVMFSIPEKGEPRGLHYDIVKALARELGEPIAIELAPFPRAIETFAVGAADLFISIDNARIQEIGSQKIPLLKAQVVLVSPKDKPVHSIESFTGIVGRLRGGCFELRDHKAISFWDLNSYSQGLRLLQVGRLPALCGSNAIFIDAEQLDLPMSHWSVLVLRVYTVWLHVRTNLDSARFSRIGRAVQALGDSGEIEQFSNVYLRWVPTEP